MASKPPPSHLRRMVALSVLVDYRPVWDEWYILDLTIAAPASEAEAVRERLAAQISSGRCAAIWDAEGTDWSFLPGTVRAFWSRGLLLPGEANDPN